MKWLRKNLLLILIILLATLLRIISLSSIPIGFNDDEAAFGYNAYSILKTGRDEWGRFLPFPVFESFGDWKLVGYLYLVVISQLIFGVNEFATRLPSAFFGILAISSTYLLAKKLFDQRVALVASLFLTISPWHIIASRNAFESDILIFFLSFSTLLFLKGLQDKRFLTLSFVGFGISLYIYRSAWLFVPLFLATLLYFTRRELKIPKNPQILVKPLLVLLILTLPLLPAVLTFKGQSRFFQESFILGIQRVGIIADVNKRRGDCQENLPVSICTAIYNKYSFFLSTYLNNYFSNLSLETFYVRGNPTGYQSAPARGFFYVFELPFLVAGLIFLLRTKHPAFKILIPWILIVPIGASLTSVGNPGRLNILMPVPQMIAAFGLVKILSLFKENNPAKKIFTVSLFIIVIASFVRFIVDIVYYYPKIYGRYQRYGYKQLFDYLQSQQSSYDQIVVSRKSDDAKQYIHYLFYEKYDPHRYQESETVVKYRGEDKWVRVEKIDKFRFYPEILEPGALPEKTLLAVGEKELNIQTDPIFTVVDLNGDRLFEVYDGDGIKEKLKETKIE